jgi:hypothetical protein
MQEFAYHILPFFSTNAPTKTIISLKKALQVSAIKE